MEIYEFRVKGQISGMKSVVIGVSQDIVLGLLLILLYTNDLSESIDNSKLSVFADDTAAVNTIKSAERLVQTHVDNMQGWFSSDKSTVNFDKCEAFSFQIGLPEHVSIIGKKTSL